jgi:uncharacterized protein
MTRSDAMSLVTRLTTNKNLIKHMLAVEVIMRALAKKFNEDEEMWGIAGLVHDADYDMFAKTDPKNHPSVIFDELTTLNADQKIIDAVKAHAWGWREDLPEPKTKMEWALFTCDELSGFIIACALVRPEKKLSAVTLESVQKKWHQKAFAAGVIRENIELCDSKLGIPLPEFIQIAISSMQEISNELGL